MNLNIHSGTRVLYKQGSSNWLIGTINKGNAEVNEQGLWIPIIPKNNDEEIHYAEINAIFLDAFPIDEWIKEYSEYFMTKEDYIKFIEDENFDRRLENAFVSDGEYGYYPISKFSRNWLEKQPFNYIIRSN